MLEPLVEGDASRQTLVQVCMTELVENFKGKEPDLTVFMAHLKEISTELHNEKLAIIDLHKDKLQKEFLLAQKAQDYALIVSITAVACGGLIAYLVSPIAGATISTAGLGSTIISKFMSKKQEAEKSLNSNFESEDAKD